MLVLSVSKAGLRRRCPLLRATGSIRLVMRGAGLKADVFVNVHWTQDLLSARLLSLLSEPGPGSVPVPG